MDPTEKRIRTARWILFAALGAEVLAWVFPMSITTDLNTGDVRTDYLHETIIELIHVLRGIPSFGMEVGLLLFLLGCLLLYLLLIGTSAFLVRVYACSRPLRVLAIFFSILFLAVTLYSHFASDEWLTDEKVENLAGYWFDLAAVLLLVTGLCWIPRIKPPRFDGGPLIEPCEMK